MAMQTFLNTLQETNRHLDPFGVYQALSETALAWSRYPADVNKSFNDLSIRLLESHNAAYFTLLEQQCALFDGDQTSHDEDVEAMVETLTNTIHEQYMLVVNSIEEKVFSTPDVDRKIRLRAAFWVRQCFNALSPLNCFMLNPSVLYQHIKTGGESSAQGLLFWSNDAPQNKLVSMVDDTAFEVGKNLANTPGKVIFRNDLIELIQYTPTTSSVYETPVLIAPPWINKYYILDLDPKKSFVKYCVEHGHTVFMISWRNPTESMRETSFEDYLFQGIDTAVRTVKDICQVPKIHTLGFCIAGTALSTLMAWYNKRAAQGDPVPVSSWTLLCSLVDFEDPGDVGVFIDEYMISYIEDMMKKTGYLDGNDLGATFRMFRSNSLVWQYYVQQYLMGQKPDAFDVLYWNSDSTRLPEAMHSYYLRELYLNNNLVKANALTIGGESIDLNAIQQPLYCLGTEQDHITPWHEVFKICSLLQAPVHYTLSTSGHIAGVVNPPKKPAKREYWSGDASQHTNPFLWCLEHEKQSGSWWEDWTAWITQHSGKKITARTVGSKRYPAICNAPGTYVHK